MAPMLSTSGERKAKVAGSPVTFSLTSEKKWMFVQNAYISFFTSTHWYIKWHIPVANKETSWHFYIVTHEDFTQDHHASLPKIPRQNINLLPASTVTHCSCFGCGPDPAWMTRFVNVLATTSADATSFTFAEALSVFSFKLWSGFFAGPDDDLATRKAIPSNAESDISPNISIPPSLRLPTFLPFFLEGLSGGFILTGSMISLGFGEFDSIRCKSRCEMEVCRNLKVFSWLIHPWYFIWYCLHSIL